MPSIFVKDNVKQMCSIVILEYTVHIQNHIITSTNVHVGATYACILLLIFYSC